jgi:hypothetical protein
MTAAEHHDRISGRAAVGARAQSPPHAKRIGYTQGLLKRRTARLRRWLEQAEGRKSGGY